MAAMKGIFVRLKTADVSDAGADVDIYVGIFGTGGGGEFPLDVANFNDFERGQEDRYWFGNVWEGTLLTDARQPFQSQGGEWNAPDTRDIDLDLVEYVYLRKRDAFEDRDDHWQLDEVEVFLYGDHPVKRRFRKVGNVWLGKKYGSQVWLGELPVR
ncbi:MAG: PLAT/LH2 domain-containing protein [Rhodobacter sp.]|nr:PLAT/LH2 domain-containing protein [Rhodobacter sp.]